LDVDADDRITGGAGRAREGILDVVQAPDPTSSERPWLSAIRLARCRRPVQYGEPRAERVVCESLE
jgi:hypothetical protein